MPEPVAASGVADPEIRALCFDTFGTLVDWRSSLLDELTALAPDVAPAVAAAVVEGWREAYRPALDAARQQPVWRDLDALQRNVQNRVDQGQVRERRPDVAQVPAARRVELLPCSGEGPSSVSPTGQRRTSPSTVSSLRIAGPVIRGSSAGRTRTSRSAG